MVTVFVASRTVPPLAMSAYDLNFAKPFVCLDGQNRAGQRRLAVVNVANGAHVDVGFGSLKYFLGHSLSPCVQSSG